jgi:uncharacterized protein YjbI with pentapeptide repeats
MKPKETYEAYKKFKVPSLSKIRDTASEHSKTSLVIIILIVVLLLLALQYIPHLQVARFNITNQKDLADAENSYRATLAQIFGGIVIAIGIYYTWRRITIAENNLRVSQDGQITERFTRAIDQLGNEKIEIRLGGIYALERIAVESDQDYWPIMEILTAYVREKLPYDSSNRNTIYEPIYVRYLNKEKNEEPIERKVPLDIQTVLTVIGRRKYSPYTGETDFLDLSKTNLCGFSLIGAHLEEADLQRTNLQEVDLQRANLQGADLRDADLQGTNLIKVNLQGANLKHAKLRHSTLAYAVLTNANLQEADLEHSMLPKVNFENADFGNNTDYDPSIWGLDFIQGANLEQAYISESNFKNANLKGSNLKNTVIKNTNLEGANLEGASFEGASLEGTHLKGAKNITVDQLSKAKTLYNAKLDEELEDELRAKYPHLFDEPPRGPIIIEELKDESKFIPS